MWRKTDFKNALSIWHLYVGQLQKITICCISFRYGLELYSCRVSLTQQKLQIIYISSVIQNQLYRHNISWYRGSNVASCQVTEFRILFQYVAPRSFSCLLRIRTKHILGSSSQSPQRKIYQNRSNIRSIKVERNTMDACHIVIDSISGGKIEETENNFVDVENHWAVICCELVASFSC